MSFNTELVRASVAYRNASQTMQDRWQSQAKALQALIVGSAILALPAVMLVPSQLVLPSVSILSLAIAAIICAAAWTMKASSERTTLNMWDVAGLLAFIGFGSGMLVGPDAVHHILELSSRRS